MLKKSFLLVSLLMINVNSYAQSIDIQCEFERQYPLITEGKYKGWQIVDDSNADSLGTTIRLALKHPFTMDSYRYMWASFWYKSVIYFSIDQKNKNVTGGLVEAKGGLTFSPAVADIYPEEIIIEERFENVEKNKPLIHRYFINRIDGAFFGSTYRLDSKTNEDVEEYSMYGKCEPIKRLF